MDRSGTNRGEGYTGCILPVLVNRSRSTCGTVTSSASLLAPTDETTATVEFTPLSRGTLALSQTATRAIGVVDHGFPASFEARWNEGTAVLTILAPDGTLIDQAYALNNPTVVSATLTATSEHFDVIQAISGTYTLQLQATAVPTDSIDYQVVAGFQSNYALTAARNRNWYPPNDVAQLSATFSGPQPIANQQVVAYIQRSDGITDTVPLTASGSGTYAASYPVPNAPGYAEVAVVATGESNGVAFERAQSLHFQIYPPSFKLTDSYGEQATSAGLTVTAAIMANQGGPARITAMLAPAAGGPDIAVATPVTTLVTGTTTLVPIHFPAADIYAGAASGPYKISRILIFDEREATLVSDDQRDVYTTQAYSIYDFAPFHVYLPLLSK